MGCRKLWSGIRYKQWLKKTDTDSASLTKETAEKILNGQFNLLRADEVDANLVDRCLNVILSHRSHHTEEELQAGWQAIVRDAQCAENATITHTQSASRKTLRPAAVFVLAILAVLLLATGVAAAMGVNLWKVVINWDRSQLYVETESTEETADQAEDQRILLTTAGALTPFGGIEDDFYDALIQHNIRVAIPQWLPEGYRLKDVETISSEMETIVNALYEDDHGRSFNVNIDLLNNNSQSVYEKTNDEIPETITIDDHEYWIFSNLDHQMLIWTEEPYIISISGDLTKEELKQMIESIQDVDNQ